MPTSHYQLVLLTLSAKHRPANLLSGTSILEVQGTGGNVNVAKAICVLPTDDVTDRNTYMSSGCFCPQPIGKHDAVVAFESMTFTTTGP